MKLSKYLLASTMLAVSAGILSFTATTTNQPSAVGIAYAATDPDNPVLDQIMPNKKLQLLVLENMKSEGLVSDDSTIAQFTTADQFKTTLAKLTTLEWTPEESGDHSDQAYIDLEPLNGGNGLINSTNHGNYSLEGLQYATGLTRIDLHQQPLYGHEYMRNDITDVTPLEHLTKLTYIDLHGNRIKDIQPISKLPNVTSLDIAYNSIADLSSLNANQYTKHFNYIAQFVELPEKKLAGNSYNWPTPFKDSLPRGVTYENSDVTALQRSGIVVTGIDQNNPKFPSSVYLNVYYSGSIPVPIQNDGSLNFTNLQAQQMPGPSNNPWNNGMTVIPNVYKNYMIAQYKDPTYATPFITEYIPYQINVAQYNYEIQPVDTSGNPISGYTPSVISGTSGDKVTVPTINGYTVNDPKVDSNHQVTLPDGTTSQTTIIKVVYDANTVPYTIHPIDKDGHSLGHDVTGNDAAGKYVTVPDIPGYVVNDSKVVSHNDQNQVIIPDGGGTIDVVYDKSFQNDAVLNINYLDIDNNQLLQQKIVHGAIDGPYSVDSDYYPDTLTINGQSYTLVKTKMPTNLTGILTAKTAPVIFYYKKTTTPPNPNPGPNPQPNPQPTPEPVNPVNPTPVNPVNPTPTVHTGGLVAKKGEAVYALKHIYLYQNKNFTKAGRKFSYVKKPRVNRPMFVVTNYKYSKNHVLRYQVRDVNHHSKSAGMIGFITANTDYVRPVYYHSTHSTLTVINPRGVNEYKNKNLTGKVKNYKQGTQLKVKGFVKHHLTTRYLLSNAHYITGNRKLVRMGNIQQPKRVIVKKALNRYSNVNFTKRNGNFKKGQALKIKRYTYSNPYSTKTTGTKRYQVKGGYITASAKYVKVYYR